MKEKKPDRKNSKDPKFKHLDLENTNAASSNELTGMIPANPQLVDEIESYKDIHDFGNRPPADSNKSADRP